MSTASKAKGTVGALIDEAGRSNGTALAEEFGISRQYLRELIQGKYR